MRESVSTIKRNALFALQHKPTDGSRLRALYDLFMGKPAQEVNVSEMRALGYANSRNRCRAIEDLTDYYGLDIRRIGYGVYVLVSGNGTDYLEERLTQRRK